MKTKLIFFKIFFFICSFPAFSGDHTITSHGISTFGDLKYDKNFSNFEYVNINAPKGGEISLWAFGSFDSMNPYSVKGRAGAYSSIFYESLLEGSADEVDSSYGLIAENLEYPDDRSWVIFKLRKNVSFSDGTPLNAHDVLFSYETLRDKGLPSFRAVIKKDVKSSEILSDYEIKFTFNDNVPKRDLIAMVGGLPIFSKKYFTENSIDFEESSITPSIGSGPYVLEKIDVGKQIIYKFNKSYWGSDLAINRGRYNFERIRLEYYADYNSAFEGFKSGDYTFRNEASSKIWATGYNFPNFQDGWVKKESISHGNLSPGQSFVFNLRKNKFSDINVREAIGLMFNFEWSNKTLFYGLYERNNSFWDNSKLKAVGTPTDEEKLILEKIYNSPNDDIFIKDAFSFDPSSEKQLDRNILKKASRLLDESGWLVDNDGLRRKDGKSLDIEILNDSQAFDRIINPYIQNLQRLGINAKHVKIDNAQITERKRAFDFDIIVGFLSTQLTPGSELEQYFGSASADFSIFNLSGLKDENVDKLIKVVRSAQTREELNNSVKVLDRVLRSKIIWVPQWFKNKHTVAYYDFYEKPSNLPPYDLGVLDLWWFNIDKHKKFVDKGIIQ